MNEAKDAVIQVREVMPQMESAQLNLAHILVELNQFQQAVPLV
jgi:hypothetical protein